MNVLVTGCTGFIGYHLCKYLFDNNFYVIGIGSEKENNPVCHEFYQCKIEDIPIKQISNIDVCFHQGANNDTLDLNQDSMMKSNYEVPINFFYNLMKYKNCKNFIYASSCSVYGKQLAPYCVESTEPQPLNPYAASKLKFEKFADLFSKENNVKTIGLRYTNVYGPHELHKGRRASMVTQILEKIKKDENVILFKNGEQKRDWVYVNDVVQANIKAINFPKSDIFNVGYGFSYSFNEIVDIIYNKMKKNIKVSYVDCPFEEQYQSYTGVKIKKTIENLNFQPMWSLENALIDMIGN